MTLHPISATLADIRQRAALLDLVEDMFVEQILAQHPPAPANHHRIVALNLFTGALSDHIARKWLIASGMRVQAVGLAIMIVLSGCAAWAFGAVLLGAGTAMAYLTLLAAVGDIAYPGWCASAVGIYRFWRDLGFAVGALLAGIVADFFGMSAAIGAVAAIMAASGVDVAIRMYETLPRSHRLVTGVTQEAVLGAKGID